MSRPNLYPRVLAFRLDEASASKLMVIAEATGKQPAVLARELVVEAIGATIQLPKVRRRIMYGDAVRRALGELGRHGSLLNQATRTLNSMHMPNISPRDIAAAVRTISAMQTAYEKALRDIADTLGGNSAP